MRRRRAQGRFAIGKIPPTPGLVDQFFNDSTGVGEDGEIDARGPWNQGEGWQFVDAPAFADLGPNGHADIDSRVDDRTTSTTTEPELIEELLVEELRDLLSAEGQLVKALPKLTKAAAAARLKFAFENHLEETKGQVERLKECFTLLGAEPKAKPCEGMAGLLEEGNEVIEEGKEKDSVAADLALIASSQKVEHYEISAYGTARAMAGQIGLPAVAALLSQISRGRRDRGHPSHRRRSRTDVRIEDGFNEGTQTRNRDRGDRRLVRESMRRMPHLRPGSWACTPCARPLIFQHSASRVEHSQHRT